MCQTGIENGGTAHQSASLEPPRRIRTLIDILLSVALSASACLPERKLDPNLCVGVAGTSPSYLPRMPGAAPTVDFQQDFTGPGAYTSSIGCP